MNTLKVIFIFFLFFGCSRSKNQTYESNSLSSEEKKLLESFLRHILFYDDFSYVLFGDKPMSLGGFWEYSNNDHGPPSWNEIFFLTNNNNIQIQKGWKIWEQSFGKLKSSKYALVRLPSQDEINFTSLILINKENVKKTINLNLNDFKNSLGPNISAEQVLLKLLHPKTNLLDELNGYHGLLGILLGYGKNNAQLYARMNQFQESCFSPIIRCIPSKGFSSIDAEKCWISKNIIFFPDTISECTKLNDLMLTLPIFLVDPKTRETDLLNDSYLSSYHLILKAFKKKDILSVFLDKYLEDEKCSANQ